MISIYRKIEDEAMNEAGVYFEQAFIVSAEPFPEGWTTDLESVQPPDKPSELEQLKQENAELRQRQEMSEEALLQLSDMILSK